MRRRGSARRTGASDRCFDAEDRGLPVKPARGGTDESGTMAGDRSRYGLAVSAVGAIVLAVSVFLPWYGVSFTPQGIALAQQVGDQVASQLGNATLQSYMGSVHADLGALAGRELATLSAHQALKNINLVLLALAALALVDALLPLARHAARVPEGAGASV